jgi:hypothetical protein
MEKLMIYMFLTATTAVSDVSKGALVTNGLGYLSWGNVLSQS